MTRPFTRTHLVAVLAMALLVAACASSGQRVLSSDDTGPTDTTGSTETTGTSAPGPSLTDTTFAVDSVPSPVDPTTASILPGGVVDCGTFDLASGWPTTIAPPQSMSQCIVDAFHSGTQARLVLSAQTDGEGGATVTTTYLVTGQGVVHVTVDATRAADRPQLLTTNECHGLEPTWPEPTASLCDHLAD